MQTLHHYDRINLLKPSIRAANGYRIYSEKDLLQLQQIIALKFFGFELSQIKELLTDSVGALEHFMAQAKSLEQKANNLIDASNTLRTIIDDVANDKSIPWETVIKSIEVYRMAQKLADAWVKEIFTPDELQQYARFEAECWDPANSEKRAAFEKNWHNLIASITDNLNEDPNSALGIALGGKCMAIVNDLYGTKYAHLRTKKFEKGFGEGKGLTEANLTPEIVAWLDKAIDAYWRDRIYSILDQVGKSPETTVLKLWQKVLMDMYGDDEVRKAEIYDVALADARVSPAAREWLQSLRK